MPKYKQTYIYKLYTATLLYRSGSFSFHDNWAPPFVFVYGVMEVGIPVVAVGLRSYTENIVGLGQYQTGEQNIINALSSGTVHQPLLHSV